MAKRMSDDEIQDMVYKQIFGDLDGIHAHQLFDEDDEKEVPPGAEPEMASSGGVKVTIEPIMAGAQEGKPSDDDEDEDDDDLASMSPLMAQLHGKK